MYVFVTYAHERMKGVLARGLKVASNFDKKDVFFIHSGDDNWLKESGYRYQNFSFDVFLPPSDVKFPKNTKCVIFCDIPTNHAYQTSLLLATRERKIPCVVLENIYRRNQTKELVYKNIALMCDALILTGIDMFKSEERGNVYVVSPPIKNIENPNKETELKNKLGIPQDKRIIFATGYSDLKVVIKLAKSLEKELPDTIFVVSGVKKKGKEGNIFFLPYLSDEEYSLLLNSCEMRLCKKGYLQVLESIIFEKPFIILGENQGFFDNWVDPRLLNIMKYYPDFNTMFKKDVLRLMKDDLTRKRFINIIKKMHNRKIDGAKETADIIKKSSFIKRDYKKTLVLSTATKGNLSNVEKILSKNIFVLPIIFSIPFNIGGVKFSEVVRNFDFNMFGSNEDILKPGFNINYHFSYNSLHSIAGVFPWYSDLLKIISMLLDSSDKIIIVGKDTEMLLGPLLKNKKRNIISIE